MSDELEVHIMKLTVDLDNVQKDNMSLKAAFEIAEELLALEKQKVEILREALEYIDGLKESADCWEDGCLCWHSTANIALAKVKGLRDSD